MALPAPTLILKTLQRLLVAVKLFYFLLVFCLLHVGCSGSPLSQACLHSTLSSSELASYAVIHWQTDAAELTTTSDASGNYQLCGTFPANSQITSQVCVDSPIPENNELTNCSPLNFETQAENSTLDLSLNFEAKISSESQNDVGLPEKILPALALDRIETDDSGKLIYNSNKSPQKSEEGARNFHSTAQLPAPNFEVGQGAIVIASFELLYDYESQGALLQSLTHLNLKELTQALNNLNGTAQNLTDKRLYFGEGLGEIKGGPYSNVRIYITPTLGQNLCSQTETSVSLDGSVSENLVKKFLQNNLVLADLPNQNSALEQTFINAVQNKGGVNGGIIPGPFLSPSGLKSEFYNTSVKDNKNTGGIGKVYYKNLPAWDADQISQNQFLFSLLIIESDEGKFNDLIACFEGIDFYKLVKNPTTTLTLNNATFLDAQGAKPFVLSNPNLNYTAAITFAYQENLDPNL